MRKRRERLRCNGNQRWIGITSDREIVQCIAAIKTLRGLQILQRVCADKAADWAGSSTVCVRGKRTKEQQHHQCREANVQDANMWN